MLKIPIAAIVFARVTLATTFDELHQQLGNRRSCLTIGVFDGVHLGHQALINKAVTAARLQNQVAVAVTFQNHPLSVLAPPYAPKRLVTAARKVDLLHKLGIEIVLLLEFTKELASTPPEKFLSHFLLDCARLHSLICGYDFTFGCKGAGNVHTLKDAGKQSGFDVETVDSISYENRVIKSTHVRELLFAGHVSEATYLLSRPHELPGVVVSGMQRGRQIGFPTANLQPLAKHQLPAPGVYLCGARIHMEATILPAMVNIGTSPTFGENSLTIEAHLLGFDGDLLGKPLTLYFIERLRDERKFPGVSALVEQLNKDREQSRHLWNADEVDKVVQRIPGPVVHESLPV